MLWIFSFFPLPLFSEHSPNVKNPLLFLSRCFFSRPFLVFTDYLRVYQMANLLSGVSNTPYFGQFLENLPSFIPEVIFSLTLA